MPVLRLSNTMHRGIAYGALSAILAGTSYAIAGQLLQSLSVAGYLSIQLMFSFLVSLAFASAGELKRDLARLQQSRRLTWLMLLAVVTTTVGYVSTFLSIQLGNAAVTSATEVTYPLFTLAVRRWLIGAGDFGGNVASGGFLIAAGVVILSLSQGGSDLRHLRVADPSMMASIGLGMFAAMFWGANYAINEAMLTRMTVPTCFAAQTIGPCVIVTLVWLESDLHSDIAALTTDVFLAASFACIVALRMVQGWLVLWSIHRANSVIGGLVLLSFPVFTVGAQWALFGIGITPAVASAIIFVLLGMWRFLYIKG